MSEGDLKARIRADMNAARLGGDKVRARLLGTILSDIRNREIDVGHDLSDEEVVEVVGRAIKVRNEAAEQMESRPDLVKKQQDEVAVLTEYMPPQAEEEEIRTAVVAAIEAGAENIGAVMGAIMPKFKGRADGREVNRIAREELEARGAGH